jgi:hypothetical protein
MLHRSGQAYSTIVIYKCLFQMFIEDIYILLLHGLHVQQLLFLGHLESVFNARLLLSWAYSIAKGMEYLASK